jgi:hypothetical protein
MSEEAISSKKRSFVKLSLFLQTPFVSLILGGSVPLRYQAIMALFHGDDY